MCGKITINRREIKSYSLFFSVFLSYPPLSNPSLRRGFELLKCDAMLALLLRSMVRQPFPVTGADFFSALSKLPAPPASSGHCPPRISPKSACSFSDGVDDKAGGSTIMTWLSLLTASLMSCLSMTTKSRSSNRKIVDGLMSRFGAFGSWSVRFLLFGVLASPLALLLPLLPREFDCPLRSSILLSWSSTIRPMSSLKFIKSCGWRLELLLDDSLSCFARFGLEIDEGNLFELIVPLLLESVGSGVTDRFLTGNNDVSLELSGWSES